MLAVSICGSTALAGSGRHDRPKERYVEMAKRFPAVGSVVGMFTGTLVAPDWVLTCAHGGEIIDRIMPNKDLQTVRLGGIDYRIASVILHPDREPLGGSTADPRWNSYDIALIRLADRVTNVEPLGLYSGVNESGAKIVFAGCGSWIPDGRVGVPLAKANSGKRGELHAGTNRIDWIDESGLLVISFTAPKRGATDLEIGGGAGDSGGAMLIQDGDKWLIAGVAAQGEADISQNVGRYGHQLMGTRVSDYLDWIRSTIRQSHDNE